MHPEDNVVKVVTALLDRNLERLEEIEQAVSDDVVVQESEAKSADLLKGAWLRNPLFKLGGLSVINAIIAAGRERVIDPDIKELISNTLIKSILDAVIQRPGANLLEIAELIGKSPTNISGQVSTLEEQGLVIRIRDGRSKKHYITPYGQASLEQGMAESGEGFDKDSWTEFQELSSELGLTDDNINDVILLLKTGINLMDAEQLAVAQRENKEIEEVWVVSKRPLELDNPIVRKSTIDCLLREKPVNFQFWLSALDGKKIYSSLVEMLAKDLSWNVKKVCDHVKAVYSEDFTFTDYLVWNPNGKARQAFMNDTNGASTKTLFELRDSDHISRIVNKLNASLVDSDTVDDSIDGEIIKSTKSHLRLASSNGASVAG